MVSAKQFGRRRLGFRQQARCNRGIFSLQIGDNYLNHRRVCDAGDHVHRAAAFPAGLDVDAEYAFQALRLYALWVQVIATRCSAGV